jgi:acyl-CoA synthetase (AMP-forming)/AMP-acid ligase II
LVEGHGVQKASGSASSRNSASWVVAYMAVVMAGGCVTLLNGWWSGEELAHGIRLVGCRLVIADAGRAARLEGWTTERRCCRWSTTARRCKGWPR